MPLGFDPKRDIPSLEGRVILVTGGTAGLGAGSIRELSQHQPAHILFSGRNEKKAQSLVADVHKLNPDVKLTFITCDISSLSSVQQAAQKIQQATDRLDTVMLNAGIMAVDPALSKDGYETQFATNYLGHALLVKLLTPLLLRTAASQQQQQQQQQQQSSSSHDVRIINMTSIAYKQAPRDGIAFSSLKTDQRSLGMIPRWARYGQSKLAQLLYSEELARRVPELTSISVHPGVIMTGLFDGLSFATKLPVLLMSLGKKTPVEKGHYAQCWAATVDKARLKNGEYYEPVGVIGKRATAQSRDKELAARLWEWTEKELEPYSNL